MGRGLTNMRSENTLKIQHGIRNILYFWPFKIAIVDQLVEL
jgi:hypothetical protein